MRAASIRAFVYIVALVALTATAPAEESRPPVRVGIAGLVHTHVHALLGRQAVGDIEIVGIAEPNADLARRYAQQHSFDMAIVSPKLEQMLERTRPEAVAAFNEISGHLEVVRACAPRGVHVMVEKPLAISLAEAHEMAALSRRHKTLLLTNYETTWYTSNAEAFRLVSEGALGRLRKVVVHDGHQGPKEIGVNAEFLEWLIDPERNGGGAITDFGCYGANLITRLMGNAKPQSVTAITQQLKPETYPDVDDEATILLRYPGMQGIIQASWNWPFPRKDMEVYGESGQAMCVDGSRIRTRLAGEATGRERMAPVLTAPHHDPGSISRRLSCAMVAEPQTSTKTIAKRKRVTMPFPSHEELNTSA